MKVFDMEESDKETEGTPLIKKREQKGAEKGSGEGRSVSRKLRGDAGVKVNRLVSIEKTLTSSYIEIHHRKSGIVCDCRGPSNLFDCELHKKHQGFHFPPR